MEKQFKRTKGNIWNETASYDDILAMEEDREKLSGSEFQQKYEYSKSKALLILYERLPDKYQKKEKPVNSSNPDLLNFRFDKLDTHGYTIYITDEKKERINNFLNKYSGLCKQNVMDAFLEMALKMLGE